jgi:hypothetical protein
MRYGKIVLAAAAVNSVLLISSLLIYGWSESGGGAAARTTARFAVVIFLCALASPGLRRWMSFPEPPKLVLAYCAAQMVHYASVALLHGVLSQSAFILGLPQIAVVLAGFSLTLVMAATSLSKGRLPAALHKVTLYIVFLILAADYSSHPIKWMRLAAIPVFAAMVLRHVPRTRETTPRSAAAGS